VGNGGGGREGEDRGTDLGKQLNKQFERGSTMYLSNKHNTKYSIVTIQTKNIKE